MKRFYREHQAWCWMGGIGVGAAIVGTIPLTLATSQQRVDNVVEAVDLPDQIELMATIRDFKAEYEQGGHPDFERWYDSTRVGLVEAELGEDGKPVLKSRTGYRIINEYKDAQGRHINPALYDPELGDRIGSLEERNDARYESESRFNQWYRDVPGVNVTVSVPIVLTKKPGTNQYVFDSATDAPYSSLGGFFPINGEGWGNFRDNKNYHFTTEIVTTFTYNEGIGQTFKFTGDDDVWVFIDGKLAIDMGSLHSRKEQFIDLDRLGLVDGKKYDLNVFHAERRYSGSNFRIETTLQLRNGSLPMNSGLYD